MVAGSNVPGIQNDNQWRHRKRCKTKDIKASQAFAILIRTNNFTKTKIRLFKNIVLNTLLYGAECWKMTKTISHKLDVFENRCLHRILNIFWPNTISNVQLHIRTTTKPITLEVKTRSWKRIGHVLRMLTTSITRVALRWTGKDGEPRRPGEEHGWTWVFLERVAEKDYDGVLWRRPCAQTYVKRIKYIAISLNISHIKKAVQSFAEYVINLLSCPSVSYQIEGN